MLLAQPPLKLLLLFLLFLLLLLLLLLLHLLLPARQKSRSRTKVGTAALSSLKTTLGWRKMAAQAPC